MRKRVLTLANARKLHANSDSRHRFLVQLNAVSPRTLFLAPPPNEPDGGGILILA